MEFQKSTLKYLIKQGNERLELLYILQGTYQSQSYDIKSRSAVISASIMQRKKPESKDMIEVIDNEVSKFDSCNKVKRRFPIRLFRLENWF